ncbi:mCG1044787, isoform CRA_a [Mus musculus]|nr:mCG1044787, isoform CRA_a [Mus musculus]
MPALHELRGLIEAEPVSTSLWSQLKQEEDLRTLGPAWEHSEAFCTVTQHHVSDLHPDRQIDRQESVTTVHPSELLRVFPDVRPPWWKDIQLPAFYFSVTSMDLSLVQSSFSRACPQGQLCCIIGCALPHQVLPKCFPKWSICHSFPPLLLSPAGQLLLSHISVALHLDL